MLHAKVGDTVRKGMPLLTIYSNHSQSLRNALKLYAEYKPIGIGKSVTERMLMAQVPTKLPMRRMFVLER
jgi:thymidine phosphorylase